MPELPMSLLAIAHHHAEAETGQDLGAILATMEGEPVYEFHPLGRCFRGMENTRRYYRHFVDDVQGRILGATLVSEAAGPSGLVQEYDIRLILRGDAEPSVHRVMSILIFGENRLAGERIYASECFFRTLAGPLWDELEPLIVHAS